MSPRRRKSDPLPTDFDNLRENSVRDGHSPAQSVAAPRSQADKTKIQLEVAIYVESISAELRKMARDVDLESLAYFLEMVRIEACSHIERGGQTT